MKFRVWCDDIGHWSDADAIFAQSMRDAAQKCMDKLDSSGGAFPEDNDGDTCAVNVCEWEDYDEDDAPESKSFTFKLVKERRVVLS